MEAGPVKRPVLDLPQEQRHMVGRRVGQQVDDERALGRLDDRLRVPHLVDRQRRYERLARLLRRQWRDELATCQMVSPGAADTALPSSVKSIVLSWLLDTGIGLIPHSFRRRLRLNRAFHMSPIKENSKG